MTAIGRSFAQSPPLTADRPWHSADEQQIMSVARCFHPPVFRIESDRIYSLAELIDLAEAYNPETRVAGESVRAQAAAVGIARSELFPTLAAVALAGVDRTQRGDRAPPVLELRDQNGRDRHMARKKVADLLVEILADAGVRRIYDVSGESLNGITDSIRTTNRIQSIDVRHEETAAFAAGAEGHLTDTLAVCTGSCGPRNLHLINGLYDCHCSVPVLAIAAQIPSVEIGSGYFQKTHPEHFFAPCCHYCELVAQIEQMPRVLEIATQTAVSRRGVAVIPLPGDVARRDDVEQAPRLHFSEPKPTASRSDDEIKILADTQNRSKEQRFSPAPVASERMPS